MSQHSLQACFSAPVSGILWVSVPGRLSRVLQTAGTAFVQSFREVWLVCRICLRCSSSGVSACVAFWGNNKSGHTRWTCTKHAPKKMAAVHHKSLPETILFHPKTQLTKQNTLQSIWTHKSLFCSPPKAKNHWLRWSVLIAKCSYESRANYQEYFLDKVSDKVLGIAVQDSLHRLRNS